MKYLPVQIDGNNVYADILRRFTSLLIDFLFFIPIFIFFYKFKGSSIEYVLFVILFLYTLTNAYFVYFHYRFGATPGKFLLKIKVTQPDGSPIGLKQAVLRSSIELVLYLILAIAKVMAIFSADTEQYLLAGYVERNHIIALNYPIWFGTVKVVSQIWHLSNPILIFLNKRMRTLHDYIGGTVVIYKKFA